MPPPRRKGQRIDGSFQAYLELAPGPDGKRRRKVFYGKSRAEAQAKRDDYLRQEGNELPVGAAYTVRQWASMWLNNYKRDVRAKTINFYREALKNQILPIIGDMRMDDVKPVHIQAIYNSVADKSQSIIDRTRVTLKQLFSVALDNEFIRRDPTRNVKPPKGKKGTHRTLEAWEIAFVSENWREHYAGIWVMIMLYAGLRRGEMAALAWKDVNMISKTIRVERAYTWVDNDPILEDGELRVKTMAGNRTIPIPQPLLRAFREAREICEGRGPVCRPVYGGTMTASALNKGIAGFLRRMNALYQDQDVAFESQINDEETEIAFTPDGIFAGRHIKFTPHDLRHTFSTMLYDADVDVLSASKWLGHSDVATTMRIYTHLSQEKHQDAKNKWAGYWGDEADEE